VERIVVSTETEHNRLFRCGLLFYHPVGLAIFGDRLALGRTRNKFGKFLASGFGAEVE
jgi:hypothetical protein